MNRDYKIKKDFEVFFSKSRLTRDDKIKYYVYWVNNFIY